MNDAETLLERLIRSGAEFVIVGGYAAVAHGCTLLTQDLDVCCRFSSENLMSIQKALTDLHPVHRMTPNRIPLSLTPETCRGLKNLYLDTDWGALDCLSEITGIGNYEKVRAESVEIQLPSGACRLLSRNALIESKKAMGRPRDLEAVKQLQYMEQRERSEESPDSE